MNNWKKKWIAEIDDATPELDSRILAAPIPEKEVKAESVGKGFFARLFEKKGTFAISTAVVACLIMAVLLPVFLLNPTGSPDYDFTGVITVEINPACAFGVDEKGFVSSVMALNADADLMLCDEAKRQRFIGKSVDEATRLFADGAAELGFIDFDEPAAVKISGEGEGASLNIENARRGVTSYFSSKGVLSAVFGEELNADQMKQRLGLTVPEGERIESVLASASAVYSKRIAEEKSLEELTALYVESVMDGYRQALKRGVDMYEFFKKIAQKEEQISTSPHNEAIIFTDYWSVKDVYFEEKVWQDGTAMDGEFVTLMNEMTELLAEYETAYGVSVDGAVTFSAIAAQFEIFPVDTIAEWLEDFSEEILELNAELIVGLLDGIGIATERLEQLHQSIPTSVQEYIIRIGECLTESYEWHREAAKVEYERVRNEISEADYQNFIDRITEEYGSVKGYWESLNN